MRRMSQHIVKSLFQSFGTPDEPEMALVRIYRLLPVSHLPADLRPLVDQDEQYVMTLTGTYGLEDAWCDRRRSVNHKVIPIKKVMVSRLVPMFEAILVNGMQVDFQRLYATGDVVASTSGFGGTFFVPNVAVSPEHIPAQEEFVRPYGIISEVGFGGVIAGGEDLISLYTLFAFSRVRISEQTAASFYAMRPLIGTALATRSGQTIFA